MEISNKLQNALKALGTIVLIVLAALPLYYNREKKTSLEIKKISEVELTRPLNVEKLSFVYLYDSIPVEHLWQTSFVIKNTGENALYGEGFDSKNIKDNALKLYIKNCDKLLSISIADNTTDATLVKDSLKFSQWRPNEYVELLLLSDASIAPELTINDRDIQNVTISHVTYSPQEQLVPKRFVDIFPRSLYNVLWWIIVVIESISLLILLLAYIVPSFQNKNSQEKKDSTEVFVFVWIIVLILLPLMWMF